MIYYLKMIAGLQVSESERCQLKFEMPEEEKPEEEWTEDERQTYINQSKSAWLGALGIEP